MFNNYSLSDDEVLEIIKRYSNLINMYSKVNGKINDDLKSEITIAIYAYLTKNRRNN